MSNLVYRYGVIGQPQPPDDILDQADKAWRYRNELVRLELERRARYHEQVRALSPRLAQLSMDEAVTQHRLDAAIGQVLLARQDRGAGPADPELGAAAKAIRAELRAIRAEAKALRGVMHSDPRFEAWQAADGLAQKAAEKAARAAAVEGGLYWGTYLLVEDALKDVRKGAPPRFQARRDQRIAVQVQIQKGMTVGELMGQEDPRARLSLKARPGALPGSRRSELRREGQLLMRIGSAGRGGRTPVWATIRLVYHRPLPEGARIQRVVLQASRRGGALSWAVLVTLAHAPEREAAPGGTVAIDVGWRRLPGHGLRVATWAGSDGRTGEVRLPEWWLGEQAKLDRIASERSRLLDEIRPHAAERLRATALTWEHKEKDLAGVAQWRSHGRVVRLAKRLREGGEDVSQFEAWRKRDRHLWLYWDHLRAQLQASRMDLYRVAAARLAARYRDLVLEDLDLRVFHELPPAEDGKGDQRPRTFVRDAALSLLVGALDHRFGERVARVPAAYTTMTCHACQLVGDPVGATIEHTCSCGATWDQDHNAARNLLAASGTVVPWVRAALAPDEVWTYDESGPQGGNKGQRRRRPLATRSRTGRG